MNDGSTSKNQTIQSNQNISQTDPSQTGGPLVRTSSGNTGVVQQSANSGQSLKGLPAEEGRASMTSQPVSGGGKEHAGISVPSSEWIAPSTPEVQIPKELQEHMEAHAIIPTIPQDVQTAGVKHAKEATPVAIPADEPLGINTPPSVLARIKNTHKNVKDAVRWFAELVGLAQKKRDYEIAHPSADQVIHKEGGNI